MLSMIDYEWYEDGVLVEREDWNEVENGPYAIEYNEEVDSGDVD